MYDKTLFDRWKRAPPELQLLMTIAASLDDMSFVTLAPIYEYFVKPERAQSLIEGIMWMMQLDHHKHDRRSEDRMGGEFDQSNWAKGMKKRSGTLCYPCPINSSQRSWDSINIHSQKGTPP
jgi:hypothetical protein